MDRSIILLGRRTSASTENVMTNGASKEAIKFLSSCIKLLKIGRFSRVNYSRPVNEGAKLKVKSR